MQVLRVCLFLLSLLAIIFPVFTFISAFMKNTILLSIPLVGMFAVGTMTLALSLNFKAWNRNNSTKEEKTNR
ncbi:MAG: hypothetical protein A2939_01320 [Parcubacteria group bacterium RIFCSPLOWO2_01_FULL_48_18]|nr:MAG: hypothetical protein A2939_01320 [Parcubacteria group bacterium RIFCSPLOWO2_01_FULL_48_18]OHB23866.1 MAG: hypothetical protein A3J67_03225 [Parcubacteria group bacterium RIFCSPHIGHO2_02_FULL_48_10b]